MYFFLAYGSLFFFVVIVYIYAAAIASLHYFFFSWFWLGLPPLPSLPFFLNAFNLFFSLIYKCIGHYIQIIRRGGSVVAFYGGRYCVSSVIKSETL